VGASDETPNYPDIWRVLCGKPSQASADVFARIMTTHVSCTPAVIVLGVQIEVTRYIEEKILRENLIKCSALCARFSPEVLVMTCIGHRVKQAVIKDAPGRSTSDRGNPGKESIS